MRQPFDGNDSSVPAEISAMGVHGYGVGEI